MGLPPTVSPVDPRAKNIDSNNNNNNKTVAHIVTCTDGNCLGLRRRSHGAPASSSPTRHMIAAAQHDAHGDAAPVTPLLVVDTSWDGFEEIPSWVVDGYSTMLSETDHKSTQTKRSKQRASSPSNPQPPPACKRACAQTA